MKCEILNGICDYEATWVYKSNTHNPPRTLFVYDEHDEMVKDSLLARSHVVREPIVVSYEGVEIDL